MKLLIPWGSRGTLGTSRALGPIHLLPLWAQVPLSDFLCDSNTDSVIIVTIIDTMISL